MKSKKVSLIMFIIGLLMFVVAIIFVIYALLHPEASWSQKYDFRLIYTCYLLIMFALIINHVVYLIHHKKDK